MVDGHAATGQARIGGDGDEAGWQAEASVPAAEAGAGQGLAGDRPDLDPADWDAARRIGHRMLDEMFDHLQGLRDGPVWTAPDAGDRAAFRAPLPRAPQPLAEVHETFRRHILPHGSGNLHPGFMAWVQGGGTPVGMLAEMLAGGMNVNAGGRDHIAIAVERQITLWMGELYGYPTGAGGQFLTGASQANFLAVHYARQRALGPGVRRAGQGAAPLVAYASAGVHGCVPRAMEMAGLGSGALRAIGMDRAGRMDVTELAQRIAADRDAGLRPFLVVGTSGTVNTGAIDDLNALADIAAAEDLHFHVDGALGAPAMLSPALAPRLAGIDRSDSIAFDFHKWMQVPYDAGYILVRDEALMRAAFATDNAYLTRAQTGLAGGDWWPCDTGPDLSRGFRALKTWMTLSTYGTEAMGAVMARHCALAGDLAARIEAEPRLELLAPVALNVVCFGYRGGDRAINARIVEALHLRGRVAPSLTLIDGAPAIRAALVNHRTTGEDTEALLAEVLEVGATLAAEGPA